MRQVRGLGKLPQIGGQNFNMSTVAEIGALTSSEPNIGSTELEGKSQSSLG